MPNDDIYDRADRQRSQASRPGTKSCFQLLEDGVLSLEEEIEGSGEDASPLCIPWKLHTEKY